jgi:uncharacterized protein
MALFRAGVLRGERSGRFYGWMIAVCYGVGFPVTLLGMRYFAAHFDDMIRMMQIGLTINDLGGAVVALGHIGLVVLLAKRGGFGALEPRLAAAGRMAFTNYLSQTVIGVTLFYGYGFGLWGRLNRLELLGVVVAIWIVQLLWSPWWLARFRFGPAEWLWRSLTYRRRQPMRRRAEIPAA